MWPISVDQPFLANQLSQVFGCGIELVQIRTGESRPSNLHIPTLTRG